MTFDEFNKINFGDLIAIKSDTDEKKYDVINKWCDPYFCFEIIKNNEKIIISSNNIITLQELRQNKINKIMK